MTVSRAPAGSPGYRVSIILLVASNFFFWAGLYLYVPILPVYAKSLGASMSMVGVVVSAYAIAQLLLRIPIGIGADALGKRKPFVVAGVVTVAAGALGLGLAPNLGFLFLARVLTGVGAASWVAITVMFASYYPADRSARAIGILSFVNGVAIVAATAAGGASAQVWGSKSTFFGAAVLGVVSLALLLRVREVPIARRQELSAKAFLQVAGRPVLLAVSGMAILMQFVTFSGIFGFVSVYAEQIGASKAELGIITMLHMGSSAVAALVAANLVGRFGYRLTILAAALLMSAAMVSTPFIHSIFLLDVSQVVNGAARGLLSTVFLDLSIRAVAPEQRATAMGVFQALYSIGMFLGPLLSGVVADGLGLPSVFYLSMLLSLAVAALAFLPMLPRKQGTAAGPNS